MSTTGHESEAINIGGFKKNEQKLVNKLPFCEGVCDTAADTAAKTVSIANSSHKTVEKAKIIVTFTYGISVGNATLSINGGAAKDIYYKGAALKGGMVSAGSKIILEYNGTQWDVLGVLFNEDNYVSVAESQNFSAAQKSTARSNIGAGTSSLVIGTSSGTAADGKVVNDHVVNGGIHVTSGKKSAWDAKYDKPSGGIPKADLAQTVQDSLDAAVKTVSVGSTEYTPSSGSVELPAYPTTLPASDVKAWAKENTKPGYNFSEINGEVSIAQLSTFINGVLVPDYFTKEQINDLLAGIEQFESIRVATLPTASASTTNKMYFAPTGANGAYEVWVTAKVDNSGTITYEWVKLVLSDSYTKDEIDAMIEAAANTEVVLQTQSTVTIAPNKLNLWSAPVATLSIGFLDGALGVVNEYMIQFTCPANAATELNLPSSVKWANGQDLEPEAGYTYQVSVVNNLAVYAGWEA